MMEITKAYIEVVGNNRMEDEMQAVYDELQHRNFPTESFTAKRMQRRQVAVTKDSLVVSYVGTLLTTFKILELEAPQQMIIQVAYNHFCIGVFGKVMFRR